VVRARRILIVEDDVKTSASIDMYLRHEGYRTEVAHSGTDGLTLARRERPDLVILDLMLPGLNGLDVCRQLRSEWPVPVIMLTARSTEQDKLAGLDLGADDYVTKPFSPRELVARVRAVLRRTDASPEPAKAGDIVIDPNSREVTVRGEKVPCTAAEFRLLDALVRSPGRVLTREELMQRAFGDSYEGLDRTIDVHIKNLRRKIEEDRANPSRIVTVFGVGYKFVSR
jgi:two-component system alkaline phosphatase synthesis response regulator PhoP